MMTRQLQLRVTNQRRRVLGARFLIVTIALSAFQSCQSMNVRYPSGDMTPDLSPKIESLSPWQVVVPASFMARQEYLRPEDKPKFKLKIHLDWPNDAQHADSPNLPDEIYEFRLERGGTAKLKHDYRVIYVKDFRVSLSNSLSSLIPIVECETIGIEASLWLPGWPWNPLDPEIRGEVSVRSLSRLREFRTSLTFGSSVKLDLPIFADGAWTGWTTLGPPSAGSTDLKKTLFELEDGTRISLELIRVPKTDNEG